MADYSDFQLKEYENISQAHFKTNEMITAFFRYYVLIMTIPITAFGVIFTFSQCTSVLTAMHLWLWPVAVLLVAFSVLGFFMMLYITGLRSEAILYARQVNASRDYFWRVKEASNTQPLADLVLPRDKNFPKLCTRGIGNHDYLVFSFSLLNSLYFAAAVWLLKLDTAQLVKQVCNSESLAVTEHWCSITIVFIIAFMLQVGVYRLLCANQSKKFARDFPPARIVLPPTGLIHSTSKAHSVQKV